MIEIRALGPEDWPLWRRLRLAALAEAPQAFGSTLADWRGEGDTAERWQARLALPGSLNVIVACDDQPVGMASGVPAEEAGVVELISMWVVPAARRRGVGLLDEIRTIGTERHCGQLAVRPFSMSRAARWRSAVTAV